MGLVTETISSGCGVAIDLSCTNKVTHTNMNTTANTTSNTIKMMIVLVMMLLSTAGFAQNTIEVPAVAAATTTVESNASINMVSWFMGTKQTTNENITKESNSKKQMMTNGIAPNRLLIKTFLKKASQYASNIA
ncbi:MAG: hypothetical protein IPP30_10740 [Flavobacterium sp.]|nr:hypothetical protein [Flavobacterium sp.]